MTKIPASTVRFARLCVYLLYCLEAGFLLMLAPWSDIWTENRLFQSSALLETVVTSAAFRGLVTGVGLALVLNALSDIVGTLWGQRRSRDVSS